MKITILLSTLIAALILNFSSASIRNTQFSRNQDFTISTSSVYSPGEDITLSVYSYSYDSQDGKIKKLDAEFRIYRITDPERFFSNQSSSYGLDLLGKDSSMLLSSVKEVKSFRKTLSPKETYGYSSIEDAIKIDVKDKGAYLVRVEAENMVAHCGFLVTDLSIIAKTGLNTMIGYSAFRSSGNAATNSKMKFFIGAEKVGEGIATDGSFFQNVSQTFEPKSDDLSRPLIIALMGDDIAVSDPYLFFGYGDNRYDIYMFTEQPVYRAGSTVNFKGTIRKRSDSGYENVPDKEIYVTVRDVKGAEIYKELKRTNDNGSFDGTLTLDEEAQTGEYSITAEIDRGSNGSASFTVEQFKKPEYKVSVKTDKGQYYGKDVLNATIEADYFFGSPVTNANVEYSILKVKYHRPWWMFSEYADWYREYYEEDEYNNSGAELIFNGTGQIGNDGKMEISYNINEEFKEREEFNWYRHYYGNDFRYIVQATVTDNARHAVSGNASAFVTRGGFYISANSVSYIYKPGETAVINVNAADYSNKPVQTQFDAYVYLTNNNYKRENRKLLEVINGNTRSDGKGTVAYNIAGNGSEGTYEVEIKARDDRSNEIISAAYFYVSSGDYSWLSTQGGEMQIVADKESYIEGDICRAVIVASVSNIDMFVTTETDNILYHNVTRLNGNSVALEIPVTDKYMSGFIINANYVKDGLHYSTSKRVAVIPVKKLLTVEVEPSLQIYKPKDEGALRVRVLDNNGLPVSDAEVSIGIVDESIYSIKEDKTQSIDKFFYGKVRAGVSSGYDSKRTNTGRARLMTIYEKFKMKSLNKGQLGTLRGTVIDEKNQPVPKAVIVIDEIYYAGVTGEDGSFEFELPEGTYNVGVFSYVAILGNREVDVEARETRSVSLRINSKDHIPNVEDIGEGRTMEMDGAIVPQEISLEAPRSELKMMAKDKSPGDGEQLVAAEVRSDFRDAVMWSPFTRTGYDGYADVMVKYPDNLTSWRITSRVITKDTKVGQATKTVITRKDLLVRLEAPRFMREKDEVTISAIVHNYLQSEKRTKVSFRSENVSLVSGQATREIVLKPDSEQRLDFVVKADNPNGHAVVWAEALTNEESDAMEIRVPLQATGLKLSKSIIADFADVTKTEYKTMEIPSGTDLRSSGMHVTIDPSLASTILTSMDDLIGYPYGCVEQTMSRFLPTVIVANAFGKLNAPISEATRTELPKMVNKGMSRLYSFQHSDGGWGWWENDNSNPFMTAYVIYGLSIANETGYPVNKTSLGRGIGSIKNQLTSSGLENTTKAYMLYSLAIASKPDHELVRDELSKLDKTELNNYAKSLIALTWKIIGDNSRAKEALADLEKNVIKLQGEGAAYWEGKQFHYNWQDDKVQTTAMALKAFVNIDEKSELKDMVIRWLIMQRQGTSWRSTQETAIIIYSMVDYLKTSQELDPDYSLSVFVNDKNILQKQMTKSDVFAKSETIKLDGKDLLPGTNNIRIEKSGKGKVYFASTLNYYKPFDQVKSEEDGYRVEKEMFVLNKYEEYGGDKITYKPLPFTGTIKSGEVMLVKVRVHSKDDNNNYFMLEDPLPSGVEIVKDDWTYPIENDNNYQGYDRYYWRWWYADKDVRDDKVVFFATSFGKGVFEFSYLMRAEIPGDYSVNPAKGSLMYYPEVYGNTEGTKLKIIEN